MLRFLFATLSVFFVFEGVLSAQAPVSHSSDVTDDGQASYIDDDDRRSLANLQFDTDPQHERALQLTISAEGPMVEPIAGFRGIQGSNRYTAEELGLILQRHHRARVVTTFDSGLSVICLLYTSPSPRDS